MIYCCYCSFCPSGSGKVAIMKVLVVTLEVMLLGRVRSRIKSESKMIQKELKKKLRMKGYYCSFKVYYNKLHTCKNSKVICFLIVSPKRCNIVHNALYINLKYNCMNSVLRCKCDDAAIVIHFRRLFVVANAKSVNVVSATSQIC